MYHTAAEEGRPPPPAFVFLVRTRYSLHRHPATASPTHSYLEIEKRPNLKRCLAMISLSIFTLYSEGNYQTKKGKKKEKEREERTTGGKSQGA